MKDFCPVHLTRAYRILRDILLQVKQLQSEKWGGDIYSRGDSIARFPASNRRRHFAQVRDWSCLLRGNSGAGSHKAE